MATPDAHPQSPPAGSTCPLRLAQTAVSSPATGSGHAKYADIVATNALVNYFDPTSYRMLCELVDKETVRDGYRVWQQQGGRDREHQLLETVKAFVKAAGIHLEEWESRCFTEVLHKAFDDIDDNFLSDEECPLLELCQRAVTENGLDGYVEMHRWLGNTYYRTPCPVVKQECIDALKRQFQGNKYAEDIALAL